LFLKENKLLPQRLLYYAVTMFCRKWIHCTNAIWTCV